MADLSVVLMVVLLVALLVVLLVVLLAALVLTSADPMVVLLDYLLAAQKVVM